VIFVVAKRSGSFLDSSALLKGQLFPLGVLLDDTTLKFQDLVPDGIISLCIWHYDGWTELILAAIDGDPSKVVSSFLKGCCTK
jgi:hypothetical protein